MTEFEFLRSMYRRLEEAKRIDALLVKHVPKCVDGAASCHIVMAIRDYLDLRRSQS